MGLIEITLFATLCWELPSLPFENGGFDIALSSHFLFLSAKIRRVPYEFQRGGNEMLLIEPV